MVARRLGLGGDVRTLRQLQEQSGAPLEAMPALVRLHLPEGPLSLAQVCRELGPDAESRFGNPSLAGPYRVLDRALHVFEESLRVGRFVQPGVSPAELGQLMNGSHASLASQFDCSCPELDKLTAHARSLGSLGSRLTGAGWGGWSVHLVPIALQEHFCERLWAHLQQLRPELRDRRREDVIVVSQPARGANYFE